MQQAGRHGRSPSLLLLGAITLAYFVTGRFGLGLFIAEGTATLVWPPTGIAIAAVLLYGARVWPGILAGALLVNIGIGLPLQPAFTIAAGNTLEALCALYLLRAFGVTQNPFDNVRQNLLYVVLAGAIATNVSALVGATTTIAFNIKPATAFGNLWLLWWLGDMAGALLLAPMLYLVGRRWQDRAHPDRHARWGMTGRYGEFAMILGLAILVSLALHDGWLPEKASASMTWLPFLLLLWAARRFSPLATVSVSLAVSVSTIYAVLQSGSLTDRATTNEHLVYLYTFLFVQAAAALVASAFVHERRLMMLELRKAREEAQRASEQKSRFLANMSHEIRTPLNGIIGMSSLLQDEVSDRGQRERLRIIHASAESLLNILNDIIDHARIEAGRVAIEPRIFPLQPLLRDVLGLFEPQADLKGIALRARLDGNLPPQVTGDDTRLRQVLVNILSNAIKFTERGSVELHVSRDDRDADRLRFCIRDSGIGIAPDALERVMEPFTQADGSTTRRYGGSGLGLTISKQLVTAMSGDILLTSDGNGTQVEISLPLPAGAAPDAARLPVPEPAAAGPHQPRVLLAEDNDINAMVTRQMLESLGCSVTLAFDGEQALARAGDGFDLLLMDCHMPRRDGYDASRAIRDRERGTGRHVPIVALTANVMPDERDRCLAAGMDDYLGKPLRLADLRYVLAHHVKPAAQP